MATITNQNEKLPVYTLEIILQQLLEFSENRALTVKYACQYSRKKGKIQM